MTVGGQTVTKKSPTRRTLRHVETAKEFQKWLDEHPNAPLIKRFRKFNEIADEIYGR